MVLVAVPLILQISLLIFLPLFELDLEKQLQLHRNFCLLYRVDVVLDREV